MSSIKALFNYYCDIVYFIFTMYFLFAILAVLNDAVQAPSIGGLIIFNF